MARYLSKRLLLLLPSLFVPLLLMFLLLELTPGDPALVLLGEHATTDQLDAMRTELGLDEPLVVRFLEWVGNIFTLDLGNSVFSKQSVTSIISDQGFLTLHLTLLSMLVMIVVGVTSGVLSAVRRNSLIDRVSLIGATVGVAMPQFWLGLNLILVFAVRLRWFPVGGYVPLSDGIFESTRSLALPAATLGLTLAGFLARITRSSMLDVMSEPFVVAARAKGLPERRVILTHVLRPALVPVVTVIGIALAVLMSGAVAAEVVFTLPGLGRSMVNAVARRDYPVIQGIVLVVSLAYIAVNLLVDVLYAFLDPRVRYQ
jgi:peptide/nickel transport system permease protein